MPFKIALVFFVMAGISGGYILLRRLKLKGISFRLALIHGAFASAGLIISILYAAFNVDEIYPAVFAVIFAVIAAGGFVLFSYHLRGERFPIPLALIHGLLAITAIIVCLLKISNF